MGLESSFNFIDDLDTTNPTAGDNVSQGDDHLRGIKNAVKGSFTSLGSAAVTTTAAELNQLASNTVGGSTAGDIVTIDDTQTLTNKTLTSPTINGQDGYGIVFLTTPENLVSNSATKNTNTLVDMSSAYAQAHTDGAKVAILAVRHTSTTTNASETSIMSMDTDSTMTTQQLYQKSVAYNASANATAAGGCVIIQALDASSDFYWRHICDSGASASTYIQLLGYYV